MAAPNIEDAVLQTQKRRIAQRIFKELERSLCGFLGNSIGLAISGGLDSRALLEAVARWPARHKSKFFVVVVNHTIRNESLAEAKAVVARAKILGFEAETLSLYPGVKRDEASLRSGRYTSMWRALQKRDIRLLCTAHQMDDDAEGVLMDLFGLGGGASGAGMKDARVDEAGTIIRPFLKLARKDLLLFLTSIGVTDYFEDPSNQDGSCARQKARDFLRDYAHHLHKAPIERLAQVAAKRLDEQELLNSLTEGDYTEIDIPLHAQMPAALLRRALESTYRGICPERDPRNAARIIESIVKKAKCLGLIRVAGVDPRANSITLSKPLRLNFDLPGARALMTPVKVSLSRNQNDLLLQ